MAGFGEKRQRKPHPHRRRSRIRCVSWNSTNSAQSNWFEGHSPSHLHTRKPSYRKDDPRDAPYSVGLYWLLVALKIFGSPSTPTLTLKLPTPCTTDVATRSKRPIKNFAKSSRGRSQGLSLTTPTATFREIFNGPFAPVKPMNVLTKIDVRSFTRSMR